MLKKINMNHAFTCILALVLSGICHAETRSYIGERRCSPSFEGAEWVQIKGEPNKQYTVTALGIEVKGVGLIMNWHEYLMNLINDEWDLYDIALVDAKCESSNEKATNMFLVHGIPAPSLSCPKGKGVLLRFLSPNDQDPDKYIFKYKMTVVQD